MRQLSLIAVILVVGGVLGFDDAASQIAPSTNAQSATAEYDALAAQLQSLEQMLAEIGLEPRVLGEAPELLKPMPDVPRNYPTPDVPGSYQYQPPLRRNWMNCDGYITNNVTQEFCEDVPPSDWRPFQFNGHRYFLVPLGPSA